MYLGTPNPGMYTQLYTCVPAACGRAAVCVWNCLLNLVHCESSEPTPHSPPTIRSRENKDLLFYPGGEKRSVKIPNIKANIFFKSKSQNLCVTAK